MTGLPMLTLLYGGCARPFGHEDNVGLEYSPHLTQRECESGGYPMAKSCPTCQSRGHCDPILAKGKQGIWYWTPNEHGRNTREGRGHG